MSYSYRLSFGWLFLLFASLSAGAADVAEEVSVRAGFLFNFAQFVEWPASASRQFDFCIVGDDRIAAYLTNNLAGKKLGTRQVAIKKDPPQFRECSVIYVGRGAKKSALLIAQAVAGTPVLLVSEFPEFGAQGIAINFFLDEERLRFEIHTGAVDKAGLRVSSRLLKLARIADASR